MPSVITFVLTEKIVNWVAEKQTITGRGFHYERTVVAHELLDLMKKGMLTGKVRLKRYK